MPVLEAVPKPPMVGLRNTRDAAPRLFFFIGLACSGCWTVSATAVGGGGLAGGSCGLGVLTLMHMGYSGVRNWFSNWSS